MLQNRKFYVRNSYQRLNRGYQLVGAYFFKLSLVIFSVVSTVWIGQSLYNPSFFPVRYIKIIGNGSEQAKAAVKKAIEPFETKGLFRINFQTLEAQSKQWTWMERMRVWRIVPGVLMIQLRTRVPVAIFQSDTIPPEQCTQWLDRTGYLFDVVPYITVTHLPKLIGSREQLHHLLQCYQALEALLKPQSLQIASIYLDPAARCCVVLTNGIRLLLGHLDPYKKIQQLFDVHPSVLHQADKIEQLDLRYPTGMAVTWRESIA
jgi:cell division protein FtsQ